MSDGGVKRHDKEEGSGCVDWESMNLLVFDDGHTPETMGSVGTRIAEYTLFQRRQTSQVHVYTNALPEVLVDAAYEKTAGNLQPSWGDYVTVQRIKEYWDRDAKGLVQLPLSSKDLTVSLAAHFIELSFGECRKPSKHFDSSGAQTPHQLWSHNDFDEQAHGVAVWGLTAHVQSQVPYHLDYAEQIRYESNVIVPPLLAGTLQCTRDKIHGGDFVVSLEGIPHYQKHGYKCKRRQPSLDGMITVPYHFNQLTCHLGNLPHASTKIEHIGGKQSRVIIGFNVFGHDVGPTVQRAPEHSDQFRRKIQAHRALLRLRSNKESLSLEQLKRNKPLSKLLVLAKRERIKQQYHEAQQRLMAEIPHLLPSTVQELMDRLYDENTTWCWPASPTDIQVFIHHQIQKGKLEVIEVHDMSAGLISPATTIGLPTNRQPFLKNHCTNH